MKKKNAAIVFGITDNYDFALANVLIGMKNHCKPFWDDIIVFHIGLSVEKQEKLNQILKCKFIDYEELSKKINISSDVIKTYSLLTFARFECFNLLKEYKNVIWHDVDILIQSDFSSLLDYCKEYGFSTTIATGNFYIESNFKKLIPEYDMFSPLYNAGLLCLSDKLEGYEDMTAWCYKATEKYADIIRFGEQGIINLLILEKKINTGIIDIQKYCCHPLNENVSDAAIVHAYGTDKFWNSPYYQTLFPEWLNNNKEWEQLAKISSSKLTNNGPLVSVIMSVYNRIDFLNEAIESILNQTYKNIELIIVIEKTEKTSEIEKYIKNNFKDKRIKLILNSKRLGFPASLNVAINNSKGKYIARMDDDDISLPKRIEKEVAFLENNEDISIVGTFMKMFMYSDELCTAPTLDEDIKAHLLTNNPLFHPTVMFRKYDIEKNNLFYSENYITEDYELWTRAATKIKFANLDEVLLKYRASKQNSTVQNQRKIHKCVIQVMDEYYQNTLKLKLTTNEIELIYGYRYGLLNNIFNGSEARTMLKNAVNKIIVANNKIKFFDETSIYSVFKTFPGIDIKNRKRFTIKNLFLYPIKIIIKIAKFIFRPIYKRLMFRIDNLVQQRITENNQLLNIKFIPKDNKEKN